MRSDARSTTLLEPVAMMMSFGTKTLPRANTTQLHTASGRKKPACKTGCATTQTAYTRQNVGSSSRSGCMTRMRCLFIIFRRFTFAPAGFVLSPPIFTTRLDAAAAASPSVVSRSYDAVVGTLLELHSCFHISKNHDNPKQLFSTSKLALYHLCSRQFDGF